MSPERLVTGRARVTTALCPRVASAAPAHQPLLGGEPLVVLGAPRVPALVTEGVRPDRHTCFGPRGAVLIGSEGPLWICDTGHHRLLGWRGLPERDEAPADWVIGQSDFGLEGRNGRGPTTARSLNVPTGISRFGATGLAVADAWNHRVLLWKTAPEASNTPPDIVLGQADFTGCESNRGRALPSADSLFWPYGVAWEEGCLFVADSENRRVLIWRNMPKHDGQPADLVLGQTTFDRRDENAGGAPDRASMRWPHGICFWRGHLCVSDAGNNRIMVYEGVPTRSGESAKYVLGQVSDERVDHNQSSYWPRAATLNMPYGVSAVGDWLVCADTANSRLLGFHRDDLGTGQSARALTGQLDFHQKGDNRWRSAAADSLCWPYAVSACAGADGTVRVVVADSGNNRVSVWELAV